MALRDLGKKVIYLDELVFGGQAGLNQENLARWSLVHCLGKEAVLV